MALLALLAGWIGGRAMNWEPPTLIQGAVASEAVRTALAGEGGVGFVFDPVMVGPQSLPGSRITGSDLHRRGPRPLFTSRYAGNAGPSFPAYANAPRHFALWNPSADEWGLSARGLAPASARMQEIPGWSNGSLEPALPAYSQLPSLSALVAQPTPSVVVGASPARHVALADPARPRRWSADAWALMRRGGGGTLASGALPATYGASQAGAVLRYRIDPRSRYRPTAYLRSTSTLGQLRETSAALGLSARPLPSLPIIAAVEARMTDQAGMRRFQPVAMAITELPPFDLPLELRGEAYGQAGYVGGKFATPFADGQLRLDRPVLDLGAIDARLGGGLWGGVQKGAGRLDLGPSAAISMPLGRGTFGRLALDWRFRVLGAAQPQSGPAVTLSAGF